MKEFLSYLKPYKRDAVMAVFCIEAETVFELIIPWSWLPLWMWAWSMETGAIS